MTCLSAEVDAYETLRGIYGERVEGYLGCRIHVLDPSQSFPLVTVDLIGEPGWRVVRWINPRRDGCDGCQIRRGIAGEDLIEVVGEVLSER